MISGPKQVHVSLALSFKFFDVLVF